MEHEERIEFLREMIKQEGWGGALLFYSRDVFYYTGTAQPSYLMVFPDDHTLYVRSGFEFASKEVFIDKEKIREERHLENIYKEVFHRFQEKRIATELDLLPANEFLKFQRIFKGFEFLDVSPHVLEQRKRKDPSEIERIKEACDAIDTGHRAVLSDLKEGTTELEIAAAVENAHRLAGHEGIFFIRQPDFFMSRGPISSGPNLFKISGVVYTVTGVGLSPSVPAGPSRRRMSEGDLLIVDIPVLVNGYHADQTRTYVLGKADEKVKTTYEKLKGIADHLIENIGPGMRCSEIYKLAVAKSEALGAGDAFLSFGRGKRSHLIGHGIGLEINEPPVLAPNDHSIVSDGYVIALDMHILDEEVGVFKLEDMILIGEKDNQILTKSPRELFEIQ
jgi:Xaa-Pro aminopeptidase